jgi:hypothetical protein
LLLDLKPDAELVVQSEGFDGELTARFHARECGEDYGTEGVPLSLGAFAWLLSLHPTAAGRTYAGYGGVYVSTAVLWLWLVEKQQPIDETSSVPRCASWGWPSSCLDLEADRCVLLEPGCEDLLGFRRSRDSHRERITGHPIDGEAKEWATPAFAVDPQGDLVFELGLLPKGHDKAIFLLAKTVD